MNSLKVGVLDVGNTRLKAGIFKEDVLDQYHEILPENDDELLSVIHQSGITHLMVSNVSGKKLNVLNQLPNDLIVHYLGSETILPFNNHYHSKHTLGADRLALVAGAQHFYKHSNCLVIDAGTCVTYDLLTKAGNYIGGNITPGMHMRLKAMHTFTGSLPLPVWNLPEQVIGTDTQSCLLTGAYYGLIGEMQYFIDSYSHSYTGLKVLLTGGDAVILAKHIKNSIFVHEHLLLYGLNKILIVNVK